MIEGAPGRSEPIDQGGDPPCWAHLFDDSDLDDSDLDDNGLDGDEHAGPAPEANPVAGASARGEGERSANEPGGDLVDGGDQ